MTRWVVVAGSALLVLGCTGAFEEARGLKEDLMPGVNRSACDGWVAHVNRLDTCFQVTYEAENLCSGVDAAPVDLRPWFDCLVQHTSCDGDQPRQEWDECPPPMGPELHG